MAFEDDVGIALAKACEQDKWFHAMDHTHYARWIPVHMRDMAKLRRIHPSIAQEFHAGNFTVQKSKECFPFGTRKCFRYLTAHEISGGLGPEKARPLPVFHALTGCYTVSSFAEEKMVP